jgi:hypothetical protein
VAEDGAVGDHGGDGCAAEGVIQILVTERSWGWEKRSDGGRATESWLTLEEEMLVCMYVSELAMVEVDHFRTNMCAKHSRRRGGKQ